MIWLMLLVSVPMGLLCLVSITAVMVSPMAFDAPESIKKPEVWGFVLGVLTFALGCWVGMAMGWLWYAYGGGAESLAWFACPLAGLVPFAVGLGISSLRAKRSGT